MAALYHGPNTPKSCLYLPHTVNRDILSELSCQDIAKEFVRSIDARCHVFDKM